MDIIEIPLEDYYKLFFSPYQIKYSRLFNRKYDNNKVLSCTGFNDNDFTSLKDGLKRELETFMHEVNNIKINIIQNAIIDKMIGKCIPLSNFSKEEKVLYIRNRFPIYNRLYSIYSKIFH